MSKGNPYGCPCDITFFKRDGKRGAGVITGNHGGLNPVRLFQSRARQFHRTVDQPVRAGVALAPLVSHASKIAFRAVSSNDSILPLRSIWLHKGRPLPAAPLTNAISSVSGLPWTCLPIQPALTARTAISISPSGRALPLARETKRTIR
jgi:hypothetical protein